MKTCYSKKTIFEVTYKAGQDKGRDIVRNSYDAGRANYSDKNELASLLQVPQLLSRRV
jgi:hypothetical protein